jgi:transposase
MAELVRAGRKAEELAREFQTTSQSIRNWVARADRDEGRRRDGLTTAEREELSRLRREISSKAALRKFSGLVRSACSFHAEIGPYHDSALSRVGTSTHFFAPERDEDTDLALTAFKNVGIHAVRGAEVQAAKPFLSLRHFELVRS